jgi:hypothetical protein
LAFGCNYLLGVSHEGREDTMAQLIMTDAERAALLWTDLDDAALGALLRKKIAFLQTAAEQMDRTVTMAAGLLLCCAAARHGCHILHGLLLQLL